MLVFCRRATQSNHGRLRRPGMRRQSRHFPIFPSCPSRLRGDLFEPKISAVICVLCGRTWTAALSATASPAPSHACAAARCAARGAAGLRRHDDRAPEEDQLEAVLERRAHSGESVCSSGRPPGMRGRTLASSCGRICTSSSGFEKYGSAACGTCAGIAARTRRGTASASSTRTPPRPPCCRSSGRRSSTRSRRPSACAARRSAPRSCRPAAAVPCRGPLMTMPKAT